MADRTPAKGLRAILRIAPRESLRLGLLSLLAAVSEGFGLVLLAPLLAILGGDQATVPSLLMPLRGLALPSLLAIFVALVALRSAIEAARALAAQALSARVTDALREEALAALLASEWRALSRQSQARLRALLITTMDRVGEAALLCADIARNAAGLLALVAAGLVLAPLATLAAALVALPAYLFYARLRRRARSLGEETSRSYDAIHRAIGETLGALRLVKSHGREKEELARSRAGFSRLRQAQRHYVFSSVLAQGTIQLLAAAALALALWAATSLWQVPLAIILPLAALAVRAVPQAAALQRALQDWHHAAPALEEASALIAEAAQWREPDGGKAPDAIHENIELVDVSLAHAEGRAALQGLSLALPALSISALSGPSGAGKSTAADVFAGLLVPDSGEVRIDGVPLDPAARKHWRRRVAYVHQEPVLFEGSVRDNLLWADPKADDARLALALASAGADFVHALPGGLDCSIGDGGRALSGGERQRIALARALLLDPVLLVLDEATSALDPESEAEIAKAVVALEGRCTVLVIGHRGQLAAAARQRFAIVGGRLNDNDF